MARLAARSDGRCGVAAIGQRRGSAMFKLPILHVSFRFEGLDDAQRYAFMKRFDLYMQRGGG
jgi:hypothetical protein